MVVGMLVCLPPGGSHRVMEGKWCWIEWYCGCNDLFDQVLPCCSGTYRPLDRWVEGGRCRSPNRCAEYVYRGLI